MSYYRLIVSFLVRLKNGAMIKQISDIYQQKYIEMQIPNTIDALASTWGANDSVHVPFTYYVSDAIALVTTLTPFSEWSNHPKFFIKMDLYSFFLINCVQLAPNAEYALFDK